MTTDKAQRSRCICSVGWLLAAVLAALAAPAVSAATVSVNGGLMTMNLDRSVFGSLNYGTASPGLFDPSDYPTYDPGLYLEEFFDQATAATVPGSQRGSYQVVPGYAEIPSTGLQYAVNGSTVTNLPGNNTKPTNFTFDTSDPSGTASGAVGFGGLMRFRGSWAAPNYSSSYFSWGEFTLEYHPESAVDGASGWTLWNHVSFPAHSFDLLNVATTVGSDHSLTLSGDLRFSPGTASSFFSPDDADKVLGDVSIHLTAVPLPAAFWLFASALAGVGAIGRRRQTAASEGS